MQAKQNNHIITNLETQKQFHQLQTLAPIKDWNPEIKALITKAKKLRGGNGQPAIYSPIFSLVNLSAQRKESVRS